MDKKLWDRLKPGLTLLLLLSGLILVATKVIGLTWWDAVTLAIFLPILVGWTYSDKFFPTERPTPLPSGFDSSFNIQKKERELASILFGVIVNEAGILYMHRPKSVHDIHVEFGAWPLEPAGNPATVVPVQCYRVLVKKAATDAAQNQNQTRIGGKLQLFLNEAGTGIRVLRCYDGDLVWEFYIDM